jgi:hypothetical protein
MTAPPQRKYPLPTLIYFTVVLQQQAATELANKRSNIAEPYGHPVQQGVSISVQ